MFAFRLTQHGGNANSESCHRNILGGRLCVWTTSSSLPSLALLLLRLPSFFGTGLLTAPPLRNGKSNIFAYEMSEKSKHGGSQTRTHVVSLRKELGSPAISGLDGITF